MAISFFQGAQLAGTFLKFSSAMNAGRASQDAGAQRNYEQQLQIKQNKIQVRDNANKREAQFQTAQASNRAFFSYLGRDIGDDRSYAAFLRKQYEIKGEDIAALGFTATGQQAQMAAQGQASLVEGQIKAKQYELAGLTGIATGLYQYDLTRT